MPDNWPRQLPNQVVRVASWQVHDDYGVFPVGSKPKSTLICPDDPPFQFLIPGHNYMFKTSPGWRAYQVWSEVIAYELSKLCGVDVPPCFIAYNDTTKEVGALIEFFYGYDDEEHQTRFFTGTNAIQRFVRAYNPESGRPHQVPLNIAVCRLYRVQFPITWWAKTMAFDALIGNTDRHAENWGLLRLATNNSANSLWRLAPAFDNGTSLGYEILEDALENAMQPAAIKKHVDKGRHHCTWGEPQNGRGDAFSDLCRTFSATIPSARPVMARLVPPSDAPVGEILSWCTKFDLPLKFSDSRAAFVERLIRGRRDSLAAALGII